MKKKIIIYSLLLSIVSISFGWSQSSSFGNTHIGSGGEMAIIDVQHNFLNGGSGVQPGIVSTERVAPRGYLSFVGTASHTGASNTAHVDGYVRTYETTAFTFPIGDNGMYRSASISTSSSAAPTDAAYFRTNPTNDTYTSTSVAVGVIGVSIVEYWDINGTTPAQITLTWDNASGVTIVGAMKIVGWNGSQWVDVPATVAGGATITAGSITTSSAITPNTYTVYTLSGFCYSLAGSTTATICDDTDKDGFPDITDTDDDNDGILDTVEDATSCSGVSGLLTVNSDCDGDGIPNRLDLDSDNDGINDVIEAGGTDVDGNGNADGIVSTSGIPASAGLGLTPPNTDVQGGADPYDLDSDNDGLFDLIEGGLASSLDADNDGKVDCTTNCDPDKDGIFTPVDGIPNIWGDALLVDLLPTIEIASVEFSTAGAQKDFVIKISEINNVTNLVIKPITFRVSKSSAFDITYTTISGISNVVSAINNNNSDWTFTETANFITVTAKSGITIPAGGSNIIGFTATRKPGIPQNTSQNITITIIYGSAGEEKVDNNIIQTTITAN